MKLDFSKMHGLGNDFVVIDAIHQSVDLNTDQVRFIADRHFGIGCDQLLLVERSNDPRADFRYRIFNADGNEVEQCGNGARCFAVFVREQGLSDKNNLPVITRGGLIHLTIEPDGEVTVDMGVPDFQPKHLPMLGEEKTFYTLSVAGELIEFGAVSMGNPHIVIRTPDVATAAVQTIGPQIQQDARFPNSVNVGFMQIVNRGEIKLRVYERGAGETLACGTGACAAVAVGCRQGWLDQHVVVNLPGGKLSVDWAGEGNAVMMKGPATTVFHGTITL